MNESNDTKSYPAPEQNSQEDNPLQGIDIRRYILALVQKLPMMFIVFIIFTALGLVAGMSLRGKSFTSRAVLLYTNPFSADNQEQESAFSLSEIDLGTIISTIKLPNNIEKMMEKLNISADPSLFAQRIHVAVNRGSDIVTIAGTGGSPKEAADIANTTLETFLKSHKALRFQETQDALSRLEKQLAVLDEQYSDVANQIEQFKKEKGISNLETETEMYLTRKAELSSSLEQNELTLATIRAQLASFGPNTGEKAAASNVPKSGERYKELTSELAKLRALYTEEHPKIIQIKAELRSFSKGGGGNGAYSANKLKVLKRRLSEAEVEEVALKNTIAELNIKMDSLTAVEKQYGSLIEKKELIKGAIARRKAEQQDAKVLLNELPDEFRLLEKAKPPLRASASKAKLVAAAIPVLGLFAAFFIVLLREFTNQTIQSPKELEGGFGLKVMAVHPHHPEGSKSQGPIKETKPYEMAISTLFADETLKKHKTLGVISILPQTGQSTVAENVAQILGKRGQSVLLIRQTPSAENQQDEKLHFRQAASSPDSAFRTIEFNSLGELLMKFSEQDKIPSERETIQTHVQTPATEPQKSVPPFKWLTNDSSPPVPNAKIHIQRHPSENGGFGHRVSGEPKLPNRPTFDHLIVDPLSLYEDPQTIELFSETDIAIIVVRAGKTKKKQLKILIEKLQKLNTITIGTVLVDAHIFYCDEQTRMSVHNRPISYGKHFIERFLVKKLLLH